MKTSAPSRPIVANTFHSGNTCPYCQAPVDVGQMVCFCNDCGAIHHDTCWARKQGCASYHCDTAVRTTAGNAQPDIVIREDELANITVPVRPARQAPQDVAASFMPKGPVSTSRLAVAGAIVAGLSAIGLLGAVAGHQKLVILGIMLCLAATVLGVIALVIITTPENRRSGMPLAISSIGAPGLLLIFYFAYLAYAHKHTASQQTADMRLNENLPSEQQLQSMPAPAANAMRANVIIKNNAGVLEGMRFGSGVILKSQDRKCYILTNKHVAGDKKDNSDLRIVFYNGEESSGVVEWSGDEAVDLAIVGCQALTLDKYKPIQISPRVLSPGEKVFAIGNPVSLSWSYTEGIISGVRTSKLGNQSMEIYQTQTPINQGNSGGGLYASDGMLVGVNTWTHDKSTTEGINFAISTPSFVKLLSPAEREKYFMPNTIEGLEK
ncbi:MAG TPA: trypsin-like peptidase domain-containing protein [Planctomycetota bacterium]|nr:trypsin-like peptidase domain-containing protein [Planctomycetota bacterium]